MKKNDFIWGLVLGIVIAFLVIPTTHELFISFTGAHPYISGFIKFTILATMGELLATRIATGDYIIPKGVIYRAFIWGFLGMVITLVFNVLSTGISGVMSKGLLPGGDSKFLFALFTSTFMNTTFAPAMMAFHRYTDTYLDLKYEGKKNITSSDVVSNIDFNSFFSFVLFKTVPIFWIPAHTITFLLPGEYRVLMAAFLSMALGAILAFAKRKK